MNGKLSSWHNRTAQATLLIASALLVQCATAASAPAVPPVITSTSASASQVKAGDTVTITVKGTTTEKFSIRPENGGIFGPNRYAVACRAPGGRAEGIILASGAWSFSCMAVVHLDAPPGTYTTEGLGITARSPTGHEDLHIKGSPVSFQVTNPKFQAMVPPVITGTSVSAPQVKSGGQITLTVKGTASSPVLIELGASVRGPNGYQLPCMAARPTSGASGPWSASCTIIVNSNPRTHVNPPPGAYTAEPSVVATSATGSRAGEKPQTARVTGASVSFQVLPSK